MTSLGVIDVFDIDSSFESESTRPAVPGGARTSAIGVTPWRAKNSGADDRLAAAIQSNLEATLNEARRRVASVHSSTTLASLAQAQESVGDSEAAITNARSAIQLCVSGRGDLLDPAAAWLSLDVLLRAGQVDEVLELSEHLPLSAQFRLELAATLAATTRFDEARRQIESVEASKRDAVLGFLLLVEGKYSAAVPHLRTALRDVPSDADTALNLSIALWNLGSRRKALGAALQARSVAPGREDVFLHLFELLLAENRFLQVDDEIRALMERGLDPSPRLLVLHARSILAANDLERATRILEKAREKAATAGDISTVAEIRSNLVRIRAHRDKISRDDAVEELVKLHREYPDIDVVVANLGHMVWRKHHAGILRRAFEDVRPGAAAARSAFLSYRIAMLEGNNDQAADYALEWVRLEPHNTHAITSVIVALGIGQERWKEAADYALEAISSDNQDHTDLNNAAYVLSMAGLGDRAVKLLTPYADESFVLKATLGLAHLASNNIEEGMRLYRQAANEAEKTKDDSRSLMTAYQALVVRQLGLLDSADPAVISALSLPPFPLPDDWRDRPEFLRLYAIAERHGYEWPLTL